MEEIIKFTGLKSGPGIKFKLEKAQSSLSDFLVAKTGIEPVTFGL